MGRRWQDHEIAAPETRVRVERALATARVVLGGFSLAAVYIDSARAAPDQAATHEFLAAYIAFAAAVFVLIRVVPRYLHDAGVAVHLVDVLWVAAITILAYRPDGLPVLLVVFVLLAAAVRWGPVATLATGGVAVASYLAQGLFMPPVTPGGSAPGMARAVIVSGYFLVLTWMVGYLAAQGRAYIAERGAVSRVLAGIGHSASFSNGLGLLIGECLRHVGSSRALVVVEALTSHRLYLWRMSRQRDGRSSKPVLQDLAPGDRNLYLGAPPGGMQVWHVSRTSDGALAARGLGPNALDGLSNADGSFARPLLERHGVSSLLAADAAVGDDWRARMILLSPASRSADDLHYLRLITAQVSPALHSEYRVSRVRSRVSAMERSRFARELHDGTLQALIGLEMQVEVLRRHAERAPLPEPRVRQIRDQLRLNIADARDLMLRLKPAPMSGADVLRVIAELAGRLRREGGLEVRVVSTISHLDCAPRTCRHLARIVQEALTNVRKHSGAQAVTVTINETDRIGRLVIEDNGRGFAFSGRLTLDQLEATDIGPSLIKERVRAMGGNLTIASRPGAGADIEVEWPRTVHA